MKKRIFMVKIFSFLALGVLLLIPLNAHAQAQPQPPTQPQPPADERRFGFGFGFNAYLPSDSRFSGQGNMFLLTFKLSEDFNISLLREEFKLNGSGNSTANVKKDVDMDCNLTGLRILRRISRVLNIGIEIGSAEYSNAMAGNTFLAGFIASFTVIQGRDKVFDTKLDIDLGYRMINTNNVDLFNNPTNLVKELSGFMLGLNFKVFF
jgi:hypothetical protein